MADDTPVPSSLRCDLCGYECVREVAQGKSFAALDCPECGHRGLMLASCFERGAGGFDLTATEPEEGERGDWWKRGSGGPA
jgi:hypothetical protein